MIAILLNGNVIALLADDVTIMDGLFHDESTCLSGLNPGCTIRHGCSLKSEASVEGPWTVGDLQDDAGFSLESMKAVRLGQLLANINAFIERKPDGKVRYDTNLKLNLIKASMDSLAAGQGKPALVTAVEAWIGAVQIKYFTLKAAINAASDVVALESVDIGLATLEAEYGVSGAVLADPDVSTEQLLG